MSANGLDVFDKTIQQTNIWLGEIMGDLGPDRQVAWHALSVVLRTLRDRLPPDLAAHMGAQLPLLIRGAYYDQFEPSRLPMKTRTLDEFLGAMEQGFANLRPVDRQDALRSVFAVLSHHLDPGQVRKVRDALPEEVRALWPDPDMRH